MPSPDQLYRGFPDFAAWDPVAAEDAELWGRFAASLEERRRAASPESLQQALDVAVRAAALDTGAIEGLYDVDRGFTMTVAIQGLAWEQMIAERGAGIRELFEAQLTAYELVLDAATRQHPVTESWIRSLHEVLCAPQETYRVLTSQGWQEHPLPKGRYKQQPNHVRLKDGTFHAYAPVDRVPSEMHRLVEQTRGTDFHSAHPVLQASYVHYALVVIHPFADGNGRVARALASVFFYRACSIPLLVFASQKPAYLDALHAADLGSLEQLLRFFRDRGIETMQLVAENLMTAASASPEEIAERIKRRLQGVDGLTPRELGDSALRLQNGILTRLRSLFDTFALAPNILLRVEAPDWSRLSFQLQDVASGASSGIEISIQILDDNSRPFRFRIAPHDDDNDYLDIRLEEVYPELTAPFEIRLDGWIRRHLGRMLAELEGSLL